MVLNEYFGYSIYIGFGKYTYNFVPKDIQKKKLTLTWKHHYSIYQNYEENFPLFHS